MKIPDIPRRRFGRTGLDMPVFSCGGMRYQHSWKDIEPSEVPADGQANLEGTILRSLELGITHIETARGYGSSEMQLGRILPKLPRAEIIVQTKVSPQATGDEFLRTFEKSLGLLGLDHVDLLSIHGINNRALLDQTLLPDGSLAAARRIQERGLARFIGFSTHGPCGVIEETIRTGEFDYVNLHWYWVNRSNGRAIGAANELDLGVFIISPSDKGGKLYEPPEKLRRLCEPLSPMQFNDLFCLAHPGIHTLSIGAARPSDFDDHVRALEWADRAQELVPQINARLLAEMESALGADWVARWEEGLPEWDEIPGGVNVWEILRLWNLARSLDLVEFGKMRYNLLGNAEHWFPGENVTKADPREVAAALAKSPFQSRIAGILEEAHALLFEAPKKRLSESD